MTSRAYAFEALPPKDREADIADELVSDLVKNVIVDDKLAAD
jgi:hypothetical protein